jgi:oligoendopeptidase F
MGVSLVDINLWRWLYENPNATPAQLKEATITIAKGIWNKYYADVFGSTDEPILAVYSHMISNPLYLSAYPIGHLIQFQLEQHIADKHFAHEIQRIFEQGSIIPQLWMKGAVGAPLSIDPTLNAAENAVTALNK